ncbi:hypothetical protein ACX80W_14775 [Arthrobacter sp. TMN-37]
MLIREDPGSAAGLLRTVPGLALHRLAERFMPLLRAAAAAVGASLLPLVLLIGSPPTWRGTWPILAVAAASTALAVWITRPLRIVR